jgi:hypothetical protein
MNQLPIKPPNHGIAVNKETIQLPGAKKKKKQKSEKSTDSSDHDNQRNRPGPRR